MNSSAPRGPRQNRTVSDLPLLLPSPQHHLKFRLPLRWTLEEAVTRDTCQRKREELGTPHLEPRRHSLLSPMGKRRQVLFSQRIRLGVGETEVIAHKEKACSTGKRQTGVDSEKVGNTH